MFSLTDRRAERSIWLLWAALFVVVAGIMVVGSSRSVVPAYRSAALGWLAGQSLYDGLGKGGFVYFPQAAILYIPFAILPEVVGEVLWRLVNIAVFAIGLHRAAKLAGERLHTPFFPLVSLVAVPMAWDCARNGQATLAMAGMMLLATVDVARGRWWRATLWLMLGVAVKPLMIVLVLLMMAIDRPMTWRVVVGAAAVLLLPFLTQYPAYVLQQYSACLENTTAATHVGAVSHGFPTPFTALWIAGVDVPEWVQTVIRLVAALATLTLCFFVRRRFDPSRSALFVYSLAATYVILFSPRTENNTYAMLGPAIGVFLAQAVLVGRRFGEGIVLCAIPLILVANRSLSHLIAPHTEAIWMTPLVGACFGAYLLARLLADGLREESESPGRRNGDGTVA